MRIYELAKEAGVTSVEVLKAAEESDIEVSSAISTVDDGEAETLRSPRGRARREAQPCGGAEREVLRGAEGEAREASRDCKGGR